MKDTVINFKKAQTEDTLNKLRNNVRDLLSMNTQYKTELADQIIKITKLEQEITDLKKERSDYYNAS
jgi:polyhydroxyalkanoate synthesis regulator phasin